MVGVRQAISLHFLGGRSSLPPFTNHDSPAPVPITDAGRARPLPPYVGKAESRMPERNQIATSFLPLPGSQPVEWRIEDRPVPYPQALAVMEERAAAIRDGTAPEMVW